MARFASRKLIAALVGVGVVVATQLGIPEAQAEEIGQLATAILCTYLAGQSVVDAVEKRKG